MWVGISQSRYQKSKWYRKIFPAAREKEFATGRMNNGMGEEEHLTGDNGGHKRFRGHM